MDPNESNNLDQKDDGNGAIKNDISSSAVAEIVDASVPEHVVSAEVVDTSVAIPSRVRNGRTYRRNNNLSSPSSSASISPERLVEVPNNEDDNTNATPNEMVELPSLETSSTSSSSVVFDMGMETDDSSDNSLNVANSMQNDHGTDSDVMDDDDHSLDRNEIAKTIKEIIDKEKPKYTWNSTYELMRREHGFSGSGHGFCSRFYSSRHVVERMKLSHHLTKHSGCVNSLNFNRAGDLLCSGSDDMRIIVWDWALNKPKCIFKSGHTENIFQTKFIDSAGCLDIVSASRDGQIRRSIIPPSGGKPQTMCLYRHMSGVHKIVTCPFSTNEIISVGEDGNIKKYDLRSDEEPIDMLKVLNKNKKKFRLFSISHHPFVPQICVCGCDNFVRVYDKRNMKETIHEMCPDRLLKASVPQITCAVYNNTGTEILASYSDDNIFLFNNANYKTGEYLHCYKGHYNHKTIKGVNFFGPNSEYVISGSDCGNIFFWDKSTESILNFMSADRMGVVNCLEPHQSIPVLATSGLDYNIKIWTPHSETYPPDLSKLPNCLKRNIKRRHMDDRNIFDHRQFQYFIRQFANRTSNENRATSISSSSSSSSSNAIDALDHIQCRQQ